MALIQSNSHPMHMGLGPQDVSLSTTSLVHVYALYDGVCKAIAQGASAAFMETAESSAIFEAIYKHRVTALTTTPYTVRCLLDDDRRNSYDLQSLQYVTTATTCIGEDVVQALIREFNLKTFIQLYGQSEIPLISAGLYNAPTNGKSIGCLAFGVEAMSRPCCSSVRGFTTAPSLGIPHPEAGEVAHALVVPELQARALSTEHITQFVEANAPKGCHLEGGVNIC
ncbi:hypothetical protein MRX96_023673 [Rhipicephalus microplus]